MTKIGTHSSPTAHSTGLVSLPDELLLDIAEFIPRQRDLARFLRAHRRLHVAFRDIILLRNIKYDNSSALMWAVRHNVVEVVYRMVRLRANLWPSPHVGELWRYALDTPLELAIRNGNLRLVKILTGEEAQKTTEILIKADWIKGFYANIGQPLCLALEKKNEQIARILINRLNGIDSVITVDEVTLEEKTALHMACDNRLVETTRYLLNQGADPNWQWKGCRLPSRYIKGLLVIKDTFRWRLEEDALEILQLLLTYGLEPGEELQKMGSEHSDPRVRYLFRKGTLRTPQDQLTAEESTALQLNNYVSFPFLTGAHSCSKLTRELNGVWVALKDVEHRKSLLSISHNTEEKREASKLDSLVVDVDPFPPFGRGSPEIDEEAQRRWANFQKMEYGRHQMVEASQSRSLEMATAKRPEPKMENFPPLSSNVPHTKKGPSGSWASFRRRDASPRCNGSALSIAIATTSNPSTAKRGGCQKAKWKKVQL